MKKFLSVLLIAAFLLCASPVYAQGRYGLTVSSAIETSTDLVAPVKSWIYGASLYADAGSSYFAIFNSATHQGGLATNVVDEIGEATQFESVHVWYEKPIYCANGISMIITTGTGWIYTGAPPE